MKVNDLFFRIPVVVFAVLMMFSLSVATEKGAAKPVAQSGKVDLNTASQKELEGLPGIGAATAKKIMASRPYSSPADLSKVGIPAKTIEKITPLVIVGAPVKSVQPSGKVQEPASSKPALKEKEAAKAAVLGGKVDLNTASQKELEGLPGIGAATAKKIMASRPYSSPADLSKAGIPAKTIEKITPMVTAGATPSAGKSTSGTVPVMPSVPTKAAPSASKAQEPTAAKTGAPSGKGMVWVNTDTKVYHREGDRWYGKTKKGEYMNEADAVKAGYREAKTAGKKD
jgi:DNA uptake protein ComE-like DNA-binding protein